MEELQQRLRDLESQKSVLFESGAADQVEVGRINAEIRAIESQIGRHAQQEVKIAEVDEMELPFDFDEATEIPGINATVREMIKEERANNYADFDAEYQRLIEEYSEKLRGSEERELQQSRIVDQLNVELDRLARVAQNESRRADELQEFVDMQKVTIAEKDREINGLNQRLAEVEQNRRNAANQLEEAQVDILRLEDQLDEMRRGDMFGERKAQQIIDVTPTTTELFEQVKKAAEAKRQVVVTGQFGANWKTVENPDGSKEVIHESQIGREVEVVDSFLPIPDIEGAAEFTNSGIECEVAQPDVVQQGSGTDSQGAENETESYLPTNESTEVAQETAHSEEATETWEESIERRVKSLEFAIHGASNSKAVA